MLKEAGAKEVHLRISSPPFLHTCYYGTDVDSENSLIANGHTPAQIADAVPKTYYAGDRDRYIEVVTTALPVSGRRKSRYSCLRTERRKATLLH